MKIVIAGGSGQVGRILARALHATADSIVILSRRPRDAPWPVVPWDGASAGAWTRSLEGADVVINLAGRSVNCRYGGAHRREILESRLASTRAIGRALAGLSRPPRVWLQASTATIYAHRHDAANDERTGILGGAELNAPDTWKFSIDVAMAWERELAAAATPGVRKVALRSAMTMSPDRGGIFDTLLRLVRSGLGGRAGDGRQFVSWIHEEDFVRAVRWLIDRDHVEGAVNLASPNPVPNEAFMRILREAAGVRGGLPSTRLMLEVGAFLLRTETELILKSRRVIPGRLLAGGFDFRFPEWKCAAEDLCRRWTAHEAW